MLGCVVCDVCWCNVLYVFACCACNVLCDDVMCGLLLVVVMCVRECVLFNVRMCVLFVICSILLSGVSRSVYGVCLCVRVRLMCVLLVMHDVMLCGLCC